MYLVELRETHDADAIPIHSPYSDGIKLVSGSINQGINAISSFDFEIDFSNPGYSHIRPLKSFVDITNPRTNKVEFSGRILNYTDSMTSSGLHSKSIICEDALSFLHDSHAPYIDFVGKGEALFAQLIDNHNLQVEAHKQYTIGVNDIQKILNPKSETTSTVSPVVLNDVVAFVTPEQTTYDAIHEHIVGMLGGEIRLSKNRGNYILDYVSAVRLDSNEPISIGKNLKQVTKKVDPSNIVTRLIPLGATIQTDAQDDNERRTTIESVNNGKIYIERSDLINQFGIQTGVYVWDSIVDKSVLRNRAITWFNEQKIVLQQFTLDAIDLSHIGKTIDEFAVGNTHQVINPIMSLDERIRIIKKSIDVVLPMNSTLTIGDKFKSLAEYQVEQRKATNDARKMQNIIAEQRRSINSLQSSISSVQTTITNTSVETLPQDLQTINSQLEQISTDISNIPSYGIVTQTSDGLMSHTDKIKLDGMSSDSVNPIEKFVTQIGDGVATEYYVSHSLGSQDVMVVARNTIAPFAQVAVDVENVDINTVRILTMNPVPVDARLSITIIG